MLAFTMPGTPLRDSFGRRFMRPFADLKRRFDLDTPMNRADYPTRRGLAISICQASQGWIGAGQSDDHGTSKKQQGAIMMKRHLQAGRGEVLARSYDYVVVGAGSAGCVVARRLLDGTNATVLLLEAGGSADGVPSITDPRQWVENLGSRYDWAYHYEPSPHVDQRSIPLALGKVLGGSGSINAMTWARGH